MTYGGLPQRDDELRAAQDNLMAALAMQRAAELEPGCAEFAEDLERLHRRIPFAHAELLQARPLASPPLTHAMASLSHRAKLL